MKLLLKLRLKPISFLVIHGINLMMIRDGNLVLTAPTIGRVSFIDTTKNPRFVLAQDVSTLAWASG